MKFRSLLKKQLITFVLLAIICSNPVWAATIDEEVIKTGLSVTDMDIEPEKSVSTLEENDQRSTERPKNDKSKEFVVKDGVWLYYNGKGGEVTVPEGVKAIDLYLLCYGDTPYKALDTSTHSKIKEYQKGVFSITKLNLPITFETFIGLDIGALSVLFEYEPVDLKDPEKINLSCRSVFPQLEEIIAAVDNTHYYSENGILLQSDSKDIVLLPNNMGESISIPEGVTSLISGMLPGEKTILDFVLYGADATLPHTAPKRLSIPSTLSSLDRSKGNPPTLETIDCDPANTVFTSEDGVLYSKDKRVLIACPEKKAQSYNIPEYVTELGPYSLCGSNLSTLPANIVKIGESSMEGTLSSEFTIPATVKEIGSGAFVLSLFSKVVIEKDGITVIPDYAFSQVGPDVGDKLELYHTDFYIPDTVKEIGYAFTFCGPVFHCESGSEAERYAIDNDLDFYIMSDDPSANIQVKNISLDPVTVFVKKGEKITIAADVNPRNASNRKLSWSSSDKNVATINSSGRVIAKGPGEAIITATAKDGSRVSRKATITVSGVSINTSKLTVQVGQMNKAVDIRLTADDLDRIRSNNKNISIKKKGTNLQITGKKIGKSTVTVITKGGSKAKLNVTVQKDKVTTKKLKVSPTNVSVKKGKSASVKVTATPNRISTGEKIKVTESKKGIVTYKIDQSTGTIKITGKKKGTCKLTINAGKKSKKITVKVTK